MNSPQIPFVKIPIWPNFISWNLQLLSFLCTRIIVQPNLRFSEFTFTLVSYARFFIYSIIINCSTFQFFKFLFDRYLPFRRLSIIPKIYLPGSLFYQIILSNDNALKHKVEKLKSRAVDNSNK